MAIKVQRLGKSPVSIESAGGVNLGSFLKNELNEDFNPSLTYTINSVKATASSEVRDGDFIQMTDKLGGGR